MMALPKIAIITYKDTLPSTKEPIEYRPFTVAEEKVLLTTLEGLDQNNTTAYQEVMEAIRKIIDACVTTKIDIENLPSFDLEYLFIKIRSKSVGETSDLQLFLDCDTGTCPETQKVTIDLNDMKLEGGEVSNKIQLTDDVGVVMKYPTSAMIQKLNLQDMKNEIEATFAIIAGCAETIWQGEQVYELSEFTNKEVQEWIESLPQECFKKIYEFFKDVPKVTIDVKYVCETCGKPQETKLEGIQSFFG